jgi:hypothetical protein
LNEFFGVLEKMGSCDEREIFRNDRLDQKDFSETKDQQELGEPKVKNMLDSPFLDSKGSLLSNG